jgi:hypothetical protein
MNHLATSMVVLGVLLVVAAADVAAEPDWLVERQREEAKAITEVRKLGGTVSIIPKSPKPISVNLEYTKVTDQWLEHLKRLDALEHLDLKHTKINGTGLEHLKSVVYLRRLDLGYTKVDDAGMEHLNGLGQLRVLDLRNTRVSDAGLQPLKAITSLRLLDARNTKVTSEGAKAFRQALPLCKIAY